MPVFQDAGRNGNSAYKIVAIPTPTVIIDRDGKLAGFSSACTTMANPREAEDPQDRIAEVLRLRSSPTARRGEVASPRAEGGINPAPPPVPWVNFSRSSYNGDS